MQHLTQRRTHVKCLSVSSHTPLCSGRMLLLDIEDEEQEDATTAVERRKALMTYMLHVTICESSNHTGSHIGVTGAAEN